jgi:O-methyltransferase involved in polyketide biosynthesis
MERNFDTISPSAKMLLLMKSLTDIPFAKEAAEIVFPREELDKLPELQKSRYFLGASLHFENRYKSIDKILEDIKPKNTLELSSGFSLRGLSMAMNENIFYIDTDLPGVIETKKNLTQSLIQSQVLKGTLLTQPLNAMDEQQFTATIDSFPAGPVTLVNEGLLMYLNTEEKGRLCATIRELLRKRGGCWITADIYIRGEEELRGNDDEFMKQAQSFFAAHDIQENKFTSLEEATEFFTANGFNISRTETLVPERLSALKYFGTDRMPDTLKEKLSERQTWMLEVA